MSPHARLFVNKSTNVRFTIIAFSFAFASAAGPLSAQSYLGELPRVPVVTGAELLLRDGSAHAARGHWEEARRAFEAAITADISSPVAHYNLGVALAALGRADEARAAYADALRCDPNLVEARVNIGVELAKQGRHADALVHLARAAKRSPDLAAAHHNLGIVLGELGLLEGAVKSLERAQRLSPRDLVIRQALAETHYNRGVTLARRGRWAEAVDACRQALKSRPDLVQARTLLFSLQSATNAPRSARASAPIGAEGKVSEGALRVP